MSVKYKTGDNQVAHFISFSIVEWIDALTRIEYKHIITDSLAYCVEQKGMCLNAWIIMSNHIPFIMSAEKDFIISNILTDFKKYTSKQIINFLKQNPKENRKEWML